MLRTMIFSLAYFQRRGSAYVNKSVTRWRMYFVVNILQCTNVQVVRLLYRNRLFSPSEAGGKLRAIITLCGQDRARGDQIIVSDRRLIAARMAEGAGFEPAIRFPAYTLSRRAPSAARPPLRRAPRKERESRAIAPAAAQAQAAPSRGRSKAVANKRQ
jgi:hypothetical protein